MGENEVTIAGSNITKAIIRNNESGKEYDLVTTDISPTPLTILTINESMFQTGVSGVLNFTDTGDIVQTLPVRGGEELEIEIYNQRTDDTIALKFYVHTVTCISDEQQERKASSGKLREWKLEFTSYETLYLNYTEPVIFEDGDDFVTKIVSDEGDEQDGLVNVLADRFFNPSETSNSIQNMDVEPTGNSVWLKRNQKLYPFRKTVQQLSVLELMNYLSEKAISKENEKAVNYLFYQDLDGWYFRSINSIIKENSQREVKEYFLDEASTSADTDNAFISFTATGQFSPIKMFEAGAFISEYYRVDPDYSDPYHDFISFDGAHKQKLVQYSYQEEKDDLEKIEEYPLISENFDFEPNIPVRIYDELHGYFEPSFYNDPLIRQRHQQTSLTEIYRGDLNHMGNSGAYDKDVLWQTAFDQTNLKSETLKQILKIRRELRLKREELAKKRVLKEKWSAYRCSVCCMSGYDDGTTGSQRLGPEYKITSAGTFTDTVSYDPSDERANENGLFSSYDFDNDPELQETMQSLYRLKPPDELQGVLFGIDANIFSLQQQTVSVQSMIEVCSTNPCPQKKEWTNEDGTRSSEYVDDTWSSVYQYPGESNQYPCIGCYEILSECTGPPPECNENQQEAGTCPECSFVSNCYAKVDSPSCPLNDYSNYLTSFQKSIELLTEYKESLLSAWNKYLERKVFALAKRQYVEVPEDVSLSFQNVKSITKKKIRGSRYEVFALKQALVNDVQDSYEYLVTYNGFVGGTGNNHPYYNQNVNTELFGDQDGYLRFQDVYGFNTPVDFTGVFVYQPGYNIEQTGGVGPRSTWFTELGDTLYFRNNPTLYAEGIVPLVLSTSGFSYQGGNLKPDFVTTVNFGIPSSVVTECTQGNYGYWQCVDNIPNAGGQQTPLTSPPPPGLLRTANDSELVVSEGVVPCCGANSKTGCVYLTPEQCGSNGGVPLGVPGKDNYSCADCAGVLGSGVPADEPLSTFFDPGIPPGGPGGGNPPPPPPPPPPPGGPPSTDCINPINDIVAAACCANSNNGYPYCQSPPPPPPPPPGPPPPPPPPGNPPPDPPPPPPPPPPPGAPPPPYPPAPPDDIDIVCNEWEWVEVTGEEVCIDTTQNDGGGDARVTGVMYSGTGVDGFTSYISGEYKRFSSSINPDFLDYCKVYGCYDDPDAIYQLYRDRRNWYSPAESYQVPRRFFAENQHYIRVEFAKPIGKETLNSFAFGFVRDAGTEYYLPYIVQLTAGPFGRQSANYNMSVIGMDPYGFDIAVTRTDSWKDYDSRFKDAGQPHFWPQVSINKERFDPINRWARTQGGDGRDEFISFTGLPFSFENYAHSWHEINATYHEPNSSTMLNSYVSNQILKENNDEVLRYLKNAEYYTPYLNGGQFKENNWGGQGWFEGTYVVEDYLIWDTPDDENTEEGIWRYDVSGESEYGVVIPPQKLEENFEDYTHNLARNFSGQFVVFSREEDECPRYECANPDGPVTPPPRPENAGEPYDPYINCPMQELRPDFVEDGNFDTDLSEPTLFELETLESEINECDLIRENLGDTYLGCLYSNPNAPDSCNCPNRGEAYPEYLEVSRTYSTFWDTPDETPLRRNAQMTQFTTQRASGLLPGDLTVRPGTLIDITIPNSDNSDYPKRRESGKWMVTGIQHSFTTTQHFMNMSCNRESSYQDPTPPPPVEDES